MPDLKNNSTVENESGSRDSSKFCHKSTKVRPRITSSHVQILLTEYQSADQCNSELDDEPKYDFVVGKDIAK